MEKIKAFMRNGYSSCKTLKSIGNLVNKAIQSDFSNQKNKKVNFLNADYY
jgi:hypothetical protein